MSEPNVSESSNPD